MPHRILIIFYCCCFLFFFLHCGEKKKERTLFTLLPANHTNIHFENTLSYDKDFNIYTYRNFYNGGGVAIGDVNNDGLPDVFFTANMLPNVLYLNKGNLQFEDITSKAGIVKKSKWSTGVSMADVNGDGFLDIYVCNSGNERGEMKENELYINDGPGANGKVSFTERAKEYGLADKGYSTHAAFFDYDRDGDLDMYLLNNSFRPIGSFNLRNNERLVRDSLGGDKLYRNDGNYFRDVSVDAGIYGSIIGFGLGVVVGDVNGDDWPDIYVCNDHFERDYLYINNRNGSFTEDLQNEIGSISNASMGADLADINNDLLPDIFTTEMLPSTEARLKTNATFENWDKYRFNLEHGYYHQFTRNALQLNNGLSFEDTPRAVFSEISRLAGVHATDWSWGALIADLDNDGWKDIFVANGIYKDITNQDYIQYISSQEFASKLIDNRNLDYKKLIDLIPSNPISNHAFINGHNLRFTNESAKLGLDQPGFSNGSAYGDLDNDGDLDLVVNNVNMQPFIYRNNTSSLLPGNHYLRITLVGAKGNTLALGTKVVVYTGGQRLYQEQMPTRGYQSTVDSRLLFGLGNTNNIDSIVATWPDGKMSVVRNIKPNSELLLKHEEAIAPGLAQSTESSGNFPLFARSKESFGLDFIHKENDFIDFDRDPLIFHMLSHEGPGVAKGDIDGDGLEDIYIGGGKGQPGALYRQTPSGHFNKISNTVFEDDKDIEGVASLFFDADGDRDQDLYVCNGANELNGSPGAEDRLYINQGAGIFTTSEGAFLKGGYGASSSVAASDFDKDGDMDLFVGQAMNPLGYGLKASGKLYRNKGRGEFEDVTTAIAPGLLNIGMITTASWLDYNKDQKPDLLLAGEYMPLTIFQNTGSAFKMLVKEVGLEKTNGWWHRLLIADVNNDGYDDIIAGNHGLNSRFKAAEEGPVSMFVNDFDGNGKLEQIVSQHEGSKSYPMVLRHDLVALLPGLKSKYLKYERYKQQTIEDIFTKSELKNAIKLEAYTLETTVFINNQKGGFIKKPLPLEAQFAP
ncbi:MAG TPA: VCBS repeat-containing protein, partial [Chitinophagaceae bacterium]|nr:VCBS repeat-containing protein [Chitinophagaceae bacterium]